MVLLQEAQPRLLIVPQPERVRLGFVFKFLSDQHRCLELCLRI